MQPHSALSAHVTGRSARTTCKAVVLELQIKSVQPHHVHADWQQIESDARSTPHIKSIYGLLVSVGALKLETGHFRRVFPPSLIAPLDVHRRVVSEG